MEKIYVMGGMASENRYPKTIEVFDPTKNSWENLAVNFIIYR